MQDTIVMEIARAHSKTPAQVLLRHLIQQGVIVIPKSVTERRIKENFQVKINKIEIIHFFSIETFKWLTFL